MDYRFRNVNDAFLGLVWDISRLADHPEFVGQTASRAGKVRLFRRPVLVTYENPLECVLFNKARDANPFFHLFESLWMLAGRRDVAPLAYYNSQISEVASDDGIIFNGAYGCRWRKANQKWVEVETSIGMLPEWQYDDQLKIIIDQLKRKPESRRCVLQMWDVENDLLRIDTTKDCCCNTHAYFAIQDGKLDMTVCNRSNDMIWGMLGANVVHFSFLLEYMAACIGVKVGVYNHFTNNLHVYLDRFEPEKWIKDSMRFDYDCCTTVPLVSNPEVFDAEVVQFIDNKDWTRVWQEPFLNTVAAPMCWAFELHKRRDYRSSLNAIETIAADDWRFAARNWIEKRKANWEKKSAQASTD